MATAGDSNILGWLTCASLDVFLFLLLFLSFCCHFFSISILLSSLSFVVICCHLLSFFLSFAVIICRVCRLCIVYSNPDTIQALICILAFFTFFPLWIYQRRISGTQHQDKVLLSSFVSHNCFFFSHPRGACLLLLLLLFYFILFYSTNELLINVCMAPQPPVATQASKQPEVHTMLGSRVAS